MHPFWAARMGMYPISCEGGNKLSPGMPNKVDGYKIGMIFLF